MTTASIISTDRYPATGEENGAMTKLLLTAEEVAEVLGIGRTRVYELIGRGDIRSVKIGRSRRVSRSALVEFVQQVESAA